MAGLLFGPRRALLGGNEFEPIFKFDPLLTTFTPNMDKRAAPGPFATAPICQGFFADDSQVGDNLAIAGGSQILGYWHEDNDAYQGSLVFWITPEWDGTDAETRNIYGQWGSALNVVINPTATPNTLRAVHGASGVVLCDVSTAGWTAGTTYFVVIRWDIKNTIDGTNYACISVNNVHTFSRAATWTNSAPMAAPRIGMYTNSLYSSNAIIEGMTLYRRVLHDGAYGIAANWDDTGPIDEIEAIYAAGAGADPCLVTGSWGVVFCLPTNSAQEALVTGTGEAWSHPHSSGVLKHQWLEDGGYLGRPWAVLYDGSDTTIDCGSGATLDDMPDEANGFTVDIWARPDDWGESNTGHLVSKYVGDLSGGWMFGLDSANGLFAFVFCAGTDALSYSGTDEFTPDGKWHKFTLFFHHTANGGDGKIYFAVDGKWISSYPSQVVGVGAYQSDAAVNLHIGNSTPAPSHTQEGVVGWVHLSDNDRHSHGTDFVPDRQPPATDGNSIEMWHLDEGTGALINAEVTSPANDGTLSNGTWEEQWDQETSPIVPYSVEFDGSTTRINCGSDASIDDIQSGILYAEAWVRIGIEDDNKRVMVKGNTTTAGWVFNVNSGTIQATIFCATDYATSQSLHSTVGMRRDDKWYHILMAYNNGGDRKIYFAVNGIWAPAYDEQIAGNGAIVTDAALNLYLGFTDANTFEGAMGYARLSNVARWAVGIDFTPPSRLNPPGTDGNTKAQYNFRDGPGTVLLDETANNNDGTITPGSGGWVITPDIAIDSPGERIFNWGYVMGNDAVDEGIVETLSGLTPGENYVVRTVASIESASRGRPKIIVYDETNGAQIIALEGPSYTGNHDGGPGVATLTDTTARFPQMLVGWTLYNITDGSSTTITAISGDMQTITGVLSGGTDDDWDIGDEYRIVPPGGPSYYDDYPWIETFTFELPTIDRNGAAADCTSISVKLVNGVNNGVIKWHQIELLENLVDNPSLETGAGNPWIPDGWTNSDLDAGDTQAEAGVLHSGVGSIRFNAGSIASESVYIETAIGAGQFANIGGWAYSHGLIDGVHQDRFVHQSTLATLFQLDQSNSVSWEHLVGVARERSANGRIGLLGEAAIHYWDDIYVFKLDLVSLTVTPASQINSAESGGLRVDGHDLCSQPVPAGMFTATAGWTKFKCIFRHGAGDFQKFYGGAPYIVRHASGAGEIVLIEQTNTDFRLQFNDGGGNHSADLDMTGIINAEVEYLIEIKYNASEMILKVDGITRITITTPINFIAGAIPVTVYWGEYDGNNNQVDAVFKAP